MIALECQDCEQSSYSQLPRSLSQGYKYLHARQIPHQLSFNSQTIPYYIKYIIGVFCYRLTLNHRQTFLLHINTLAVKDIAHTKEFTHLINCAELVRRSNVYIFYTKRTQLHDINLITCSKAGDIEPMIQKIYPSPAFHKIAQAQQCL